jgi:hypothetical protein
LISTARTQQALAEYGQAGSRPHQFQSRTHQAPALGQRVARRLICIRKKGVPLRLQADAENLNNRLNVIDFGGLFSGNAIGPCRETLDAHWTG